MRNIVTRVAVAVVAAVTFAAVPVVDAPVAAHGYYKSSPIRLLWNGQCKIDSGWTNNQDIYIPRNTFECSLAWYVAGLYRMTLYEAVGRYVNAYGGVTYHAHITMTNGHTLTFYSNTFWVA